MKNLRHLLSDKAKPYYIHQDTVDSKHPLEVKNKEYHKIYEAAGVLVSERHEKSELTDLVHALLVLMNEEYL